MFDSDVADASFKVLSFSSKEKCALSISFKMLTIHGYMVVIFQEDPRISS